MADKNKHLMTPEELNARLTPEERKKLLDEMTPLGQFANVSYESYTGIYETKNYADLVYNKKGYFNTSGILFLIDMSHRNLNLLFGGNAKKVLSPSASQDASVVTTPLSQV